MEQQFIRYCKTGDLDGIKKIIKTHKTNIRVEDEHEHGFKWAYENGYLHIVKYLINLGSYSHNYNNVILL